MVGDFVSNGRVEVGGSRCSLRRQVENFARVDSHKSLVGADPFQPTEMPIPWVTNVGKAIVARPASRSFVADYGPVSIVRQIRHVRNTFSRFRRLALSIRNGACTLYPLIDWRIAMNRFARPLLQGTMRARRRQA